MSADAVARQCEQKFVDLALTDIDAEGSFCGYASLFGSVDLGKDIVERGAFAKSLRQRGAGGVRMLFQHDPNLPIGAWDEIREDDRGLFVKGHLAMGAKKAIEVRELMREGALDGLSIGFRTVRARTEAGTGVRRILEADLWEISVVTFPMLAGARVAEIKDGSGGLPTIRHFERWLTRDAGLTRGQAKSVIAKGYAHLVRERDAARSTLDGLAGVIRKAAQTINRKD